MHGTCLPAAPSPLPTDVEAVLTRLHAEFDVADEQLEADIAAAMLIDLQEETLAARAQQRKPARAARAAQQEQQHRAVEAAAAMLDSQEEEREAARATLEDKRAGALYAWHPLAGWVSSFFPPTKPLKKSELKAPKNLKNAKNKSLPSCCVARWLQACG